MELTDVQLKLLREPFEEAGALKGLTYEEIKKLLEEIAEVYIVLANENLLAKK